MRYEDLARSSLKRASLENVNRILEHEVLSCENSLTRIEELKVLIFYNKFRMNV
jgi:hypothetical protein